MKNPRLPSKAILVLFFFILFVSRTMLSVYAEEASRRFRFIVMGCAHFSTFTPKDYELLARNIKEHNPDFVLFFSDAVDAPEEKPMLILGDDFYREINKLAKVPVLDFLNKRQLTGSPFMPWEKAVLKEGQYCFEYKNNLFIYPVPGSSIGQAGKSTAESQLNFLRNFAGDTSKYNNIFLFASGSSWFGENDDWTRSIPFFVKSKVKYIFGPNLQYFDLKKAQDKEIVSKFMPCYFKRYPGGPSSHHFLTVDIDKHSAAIKLTSLTGAVPVDKKTLSKDEVSSEFHIFRERERKGSLLRLERIIDVLKIKPGMDILDIGAGEGLFTLGFAEALKGTGRVFATEVQQGWFETIRKGAQEKQLKNVFPVAVQLEGIDPFYKQHSFDIIFLCETSSCLLRPEDYFRELKPSLKKKGRLYILNRDHTLSIDDFKGDEFGDFKKVIRLLISERKDFPVFQRLDKDVRDYIKSWRGGNVPVEIRIKITQDFNKIISDRRFFKDLADYYAREDMIVEKNGRPLPGQFSVFTCDIKQYKWFIIGLDSLGVFDPPGKNTVNLLEKDLRMFNKRLLTTIFSSVKKSMFLRVKNSTISLMNSAGYDLSREYDFNKDYYFLEFKRKP